MSEHIIFGKFYLKDGIVHLEPDDKLYHIKCVCNWFELWKNN